MIKISDTKENKIFNTAVSLLKKRIVSGKEIGYFELQGTSMLPIFRPRDLLLVEHAQPDRLVKGDVVLYNKGGILCTHRYIGFGKGRKRINGGYCSGFIAKGDNVRAFDEFPVSYGQIIGRVSIIRRNRKSIDMRRLSWKIINYLIATVSEFQGNTALLWDIVKKKLQKPDEGLVDNINIVKSIIKEEHILLKGYLETNKIDMNSFRDFIFGHHLSGIFYFFFKKYPSEGLLPRELIEYFKDLYIQQWANNEHIIKEIGSLHGLFKGKENIIFLKGPFLAQRLYGDIDKRYIYDIDILVKRQDIKSTHLLLKKAGFKKTSFSLLGKGAAANFTHHFEYKKQDAHLDLHWCLASHFSLDIDYDKLWSEKKEVVFRNKSFYVLSEEYELVFKILSIFSDIQVNQLIFKSLVDMYMMLKVFYKEIDWEYFFDQRKKEKTFYISLNILSLVLGMFDCHEDFIKLHEYIEKDKERILYNGLNNKLTLFNNTKFSFRNKLWAFRLYRANIIKCFCWWAVSLPFKLAVYKNNEK